MSLSGLRTGILANHTIARCRRFSFTLVAPVATRGAAIWCTERAFGSRARQDTLERSYPSPGAVLDWLGRSARPWDRGRVEFTV